MEPQKFVVRLVDQAGELLAWSTIYAVPKPQDRGASCPFWPAEWESKGLVGPTTQFTIIREGKTHEITVHWCELDVARRNTIDQIEVQPGNQMDFTWMEPIWIVGGTRGVPLPPVTITNSVTIGVLAGKLQQRG